MYDVIKILELMAKTKKRLGDLRGELEQFYWIKEMMPCDWSKKGQVMRKLIQYTEQSNRELIDGVRVLLDDSWVLVVPDRRKANFHIYIESKDKSMAEKLFKEYSQKIEEWQK
jgi:mannose-1-phosphate guanylyltransferase/phosphomannomutase